MRLAVDGAALGSNRLVAVARVSIEQSGVELGELWALESLADGGRPVGCDEAEGLVDVVETAGEFGGENLLLSQEEETSEVISLEEVVGSKDTASEIAKVNAGKSVHTVGVTAETERLRIRLELYGIVEKDIGGVVRVGERALEYPHFQFADQLETDSII